MGSASAPDIPGPTAEETQQSQLQSQLLQRQIAQADADAADRARLTSTGYLNQQAATARVPVEQAYSQSKTNTYNQLASSITSQLKDAGLDALIPQYLAKARSDVDALQYHQGNPYTDVPTTSNVPQTQFNEEQYLANNPDVAAGIQSGQFQSGAQHYELFGKNENRNLGTVQQAGTTQQAGTPDTWDDPSALATKDYLGSVVSDTRQGRKDNAYGSATSSLQQSLGAMGLDPATTAQILGLSNTTLKNSYDTSGLSANDYSKTFDPKAVLDNTLSNVRDTRRQGYTTAARSAFSGLDPNTAFADTADDSYINDIVGGQYNDAKGALDRAKARGALDDTGYTRGVGLLGESRAAADSTAQTLGGAILTRDRSTLGGIKNDALTKASSYDFGDTFDPKTYLDSYTSKQGSLTSGLGGEVANALAGQNFFDVGSVLTKAGYAQGAQNTAPLTSGFTTPGGAAVAASKDKAKTDPRGLGGTSTF